MNKIYNIVWNNVRQSWVVAPESATRQGKQSSSCRTIASLALSGLIATTAYAETVTPNTLPTAGRVAAGQAGISQSGNIMNINQATNKAIINWNTFSIGSAATVNFIQPNRSSVTLNRVLGSDPSSIYGRLNANGQVFLINPNGVLFGRGARVDVGGLVASTLNIKDIDFLSGKYQFNGNGGSVINQGELVGKYIALFAPEVRNEGVIIAQQGTVALAGGTDTTLNLVNNQLIDVVVNKADINTLVENKHLIQADEGTVILSAQSANRLLGKVVNSGVIEAKGISNEGGKVRLLASSDIEHSGSINVDAGENGKGGTTIVLANLDNPNSRTVVTGSISAKGGKQSGDGGFVETSASHLKIDSAARIDTRATNGKTGQWLLDPYDFTIAASGGDITGTDLANALNLSDVTIQTTNSNASCTNATCGAGNAAGNGDIFVNDTINWTTANSLTLDAYRDIIFNQSVTNDDGFGFSSGLLNINYGTGGSGKAVIAQGVSWSTPTAPNIVDQSNSSVVTPFGIVDTSRDYYIGTINVPIYVQLVSGGDVYGNNTTTAAYFDAAGGNQINIASPIGAPVWSSDPATLGLGTTPLTYVSGLSSDRYSSFAAGNAANWVVTARPITLAANAQTKTYGDNLNLGSTLFSLTSGTFAAGQSVTSATLTSTNGHAGNTAQGIGTYNNEIAISAAVGAGGFVASNYAITYAAGSLTINPATLTYTADAATSTAGNAIPALSGTVTGFVNGENLGTATTGAAAFNTVATNASPAGSYAITGSGLTAANYVFVQAAGNATALTLTGAPVVPPVVPPVTTPTSTGGTGTTQVDITKNTFPLTSTTSTTPPNPTGLPDTTGGNTTSNQPQQAVNTACSGNCDITGTTYSSPTIPRPSMEVRLNAVLNYWINKVADEKANGRPVGGATERLNFVKALVNNVAYAGNYGTTMSQLRAALILDRVQTKALLGTDGPLFTDAELSELRQTLTNKKTPTTGNPNSGNGTSGSGDSNSGSGTSGSGDGTSGSGDGTSGSGDGTSGSGDGNSGSGDGNSGSGDGNSGSGDATKVAANKLKLTNHVEALKQAAIDLEKKAATLANQIDLAEKRDATREKTDAANAAFIAAEAAYVDAIRANRYSVDVATARIDASAATPPAAAAAKAALIAAKSAGAPTTPEDIAKFKAALAEANAAATAAKAAATANQSTLDSTDPELDVDKANKQADDDLDAAKKALAKDVQAEAKAADEKAAADQKAADEKKAAEEKAAADAAKVAANKTKTDNVDALKQAAIDLREKAAKLANQIDLAEKRDATAAAAKVAGDVARATNANHRTNLNVVRKAWAANSTAGVASDAAQRAGAPTTPEDLAKFKAALKEAQDAAAAADAAAVNNKKAIDSTDPDLDVDKANKQADDDLDAAKNALAKDVKAAADKAAADQAAADKAAADQAAADQEAADKKAAEDKAKADQEAADKKAAEDKAKADQEAADKKAAEDKAKADQEAADKKAAEDKAKADKAAAAANPPLSPAIISVVQEIAGAGADTILAQPADSKVGKELRAAMDAFNKRSVDAQSLRVLINAIIDDFTGAPTLIDPNNPLNQGA